MNRVKYFWQLNANRRQIIYVEKTAIIDFLGSDTPKRQPKRLRIKQLIQCVETARIAWLPVDLSQRPFDCLLHLRRFPATALQTSLDDLLLADAFCNPLWIGFGASRQIFECSQNALQFRVKIFVLVFGEIF